MQNHVVRRLIAEELLGKGCFFCGYETRLVSHRTDGVTHKKFHLMGQRQFRTEIEGGGYVRLCFRCHKAVHWCMSVLGLGWDEIRDRAVSSSGRAPVLQAGGSRFDPDTVHHFGPVV